MTNITLFIVLENCDFHYILTFTSTVYNVLFFKSQTKQSDGRENGIKRSSKHFIIIKQTQKWQEYYNQLFGPLKIHRKIAST